MTWPTSWGQEGQDEGTLQDGVEPIVSLGDLKIWLNYPNPVEPGADDALLSNLLNAACDYVEREVGPVAPTQYTERYDGWGGIELVLRHSPVLTIGYVWEYWSTGGIHILEESTPENPIDGYQLEVETGRLVRVFQGNWPRTWFPGSRNVEIQYVAGRQPIPPLLQQATCELAAHWWQQGHQAPAKGFGTPNQSAYEQVDNTAGQWIGVPNKVIDKLAMFRTPVLA